MFRLFAALCLLASLHAQQAGGRGAGAAAAQPPARIPSIEERTGGMQKLDGFFPVYWEERTGNLWLEIPRLDTPVLYATGLAAGLGSNDIGLDRGQEGGGKVVSFERVGPRVLMVQGNENFRSSSLNPAERRSVEDSFAKSILWGFTVAAEGNGRVLVDATDFFLRDGHGAGGSLGSGAAAYRVDRTRCAVYLPRTKAFPKNTEIEVTLTFTNETGGGRGGAAAGPNQGPPPIVAPNPTAAPGPIAGRGGRGGGLFSAPTSHPTTPAAVAAAPPPDPTRDRPPSSPPTPRPPRALSPDAAVAAADSSRAPSLASRPPPKPSPSANTIPSWNYPTPTTPPATTIRAPATAASPTLTTAPPSAIPWSNATCAATASKRRTPPPPSASPSSPSSIGSIPARPKTCAAPSWKAPVGGTRLSKPPDSAMPSRWPSSPMAPTPWTSATT